MFFAITVASPLQPICYVTLISVTMAAQLKISWPQYVIVASKLLQFQHNVLHELKVLLNKPDNHWSLCPE